ncbi:MAG: hypothetical protein HYT89_03260, partial [Candidatus Omnitrophica bacterium]|nr:hypothetical protein [Candidatus Omnitrophota bacterium]
MKKLLFLAFALPFFWMAFLNQGLPFSTMDDPTLLYMAQTTPYEKIISRVINPLTPTWSYQLEMQGGGEQNQLGLRPIELLIWKLLLSCFGYAPAAYFLVKAVYLALVSALIFFITWRLTENKTMATLAALFYSTALPCYMSVFFISDFGLLAQFIQGLAALLFLDIVEKTEEGELALPKLFRLCGALFLTLWLGIKTYETVKILPFIFLAFLVLRNLRNLTSWIRQKKNIALTAWLLSLFVLVVPFTANFKAVNRTAEVKNTLLPNYHWDTLYRSLLQNTKNAWETEPDIALFSFKSCLPFSIARTLGFFLCWAVVFALLYLLLRRNSLWKSLDRRKQLLWSFSGLWLLADFAALGTAREADPRHLMVPLIPVTIFLASSFFFIRQAPGTRARKVFSTVLLIGWCFSFFTNLDHQMYFRKFLGGFQIGQEKYLNFIYEDYHGKKAQSYNNMINFMLVHQALNIWHIPFIV